MFPSFAIGVDPSSEKRKLQKLTRDELQKLALNKYYLDQDFPEHSKPIDSYKFWGIASRKTLEKLSAPPSQDEAATN
ncbi:MAG: hypothetical protein ACP5U1_10920 [Desulfomonilaceae bacterium]